MNPDLISDFVKVLFSVGTVLALVYLVWLNFDRRMVKVEAELEKRATASSVQELAKDLRQTMDNCHTITASISKIEWQMGRFVSHLESERVGRAAVNSRLDKIVMELSRVRSSGSGRRTDDSISC